MTTYAVTGATGQLGRLAVDSLLDRGVPGHQVVAIVRDPEKAKPLADAGVEVRVADYDQPETLGAALAGVDRLLLISGNAVGRRARQHKNVIDAARSAGVSRIVYTSIAKAETNTMPLGDEHRATEELLGEAGIPAVIILRNSWYVENYTDQVPQFLATGSVVGATGGARVAAAPRSDYAEAAAAALVDDVDSAVYELGGPAVTVADLASVIGEVLDRHLPYQEVSLEEYRSGLLAAGLDEGTADFVTALERGTARGELDVDAADLERLLGRPATDTRTAVRALVG